jgi:carbon-monoxide dehydrogenase iron sulfur subunit
MKVTEGRIMAKTQAKAGAKTLVCRIERCLACKSCEMACVLAHSPSEDLLETVQSGRHSQRRLRVMAAGGRALPIQCRHCEDAPCMAVCPTEAIHRAGDAGPVLIDETRCIGCKMCLIVCPFGVIDLERDGKAVVKCDLCIRRTEAGQEPACVVACPTKAMTFVSMEAFTKAVRRQAAGRAADSLAKAEEEAET